MFRNVDIKKSENLRKWINEVIKSSNDTIEFKKSLFEKYNVEIRITNKTISYKYPGDVRAIRGEKLGWSYTKQYIEDRIKRQKGTHNTYNT